MDRFEVPEGSVAHLPFEPESQRGVVRSAGSAGASGEQQRFRVFLEQVLRLALKVKESRF